MRIASTLVPVVLAALSATHRLQSLTKLASCNRQRTEAERSRLVTVIANPELHVIVAFCLIGFLVALNFILRFPDFGAVIEQYNQF